MACGRVLTKTVRTSPGKLALTIARANQSQAYSLDPPYLAENHSSEPQSLFHTYAFIMMGYQTRASQHLKRPSVLPEGSRRDAVTSSLPALLPGESAVEKVQDLGHVELHVLKVQVFLIVLLHLKEIVELEV